MAKIVFPIYYEGDAGKVAFNPDNPAEFEVSLKDEAARQAVITHLTTAQRFRIPESPEIDDYREDDALPIENRTYFELALCNLYDQTGVSLVRPS